MKIKIIIGKETYEYRDITLKELPVHLHKDLMINCNKIMTVEESEKHISNLTGFTDRTIRAHNKQ